MCGNIINYLLRCWKGLMMCNSLHTHRYEASVLRVIGRFYKTCEKGNTTRDNLKLIVEENNGACQGVAFQLLLPTANTDSKLNRNISR